MTQRKVGVIIPTFNEAKNLSIFLSQPALQHFDECIVVDAMSTDSTLEKAQQFSHVTTLSCPQANRARQMNLGAKAATSDLFLFLHADTFLPRDAAKTLRATTAECGCFHRHFHPNTPLLHITSELAYWRSKLLFWCYGDQALFFQRAAFESLGGFLPLRRMEDFDLCLRAKKHFRHTVIDSRISSSARRFSSTPSRTLCRDALLSLAYACGLYTPKLLD